MLAQVLSSSFLRVCPLRVPQGYHHSRALCRVHPLDEGWLGGPTFSIASKLRFPSNSRYDSGDPDTRPRLHMAVTVTHVRLEIQIFHTGGPQYNCSGAPLAAQSMWCNWRRNSRGIPRPELGHCRTGHTCTGRILYICDCAAVSQLWPWDVQDLRRIL